MWGGLGLMLQLTYHTSSGNPHFKSSSSVRKSKSQVIGWVTACGWGLMRDCWCQRGPLMTGCRMCVRSDNPGGETTVCVCACACVWVQVCMCTLYAHMHCVYVCTCVCVYDVHACIIIACARIYYIYISLIHVCSHSQSPSVGKLCLVICLLCFGSSVLEHWRIVNWTHDVTQDCIPNWTQAHVHQTWQDSDSVNMTWNYYKFHEPEIME